MKNASIRSLQSASFTFCTQVRGIPAGNLHRAKLVGSETDGSLSLIAAKSLFDGGCADLTGLPVSIQSLEGCALEAAARLVAEDQLRIGDERVLLFLPHLAHAEVAQQIFGDVRFQGNLDQRIEDFRGFCEVSVGARDI